MADGQCPSCSHEEQAGALFLQGFGCAQSVLAPYAEECGLGKEQALRLASSFGGGMGRLREVCGACSAMFMIAGLRRGYVSASDGEGKKAQYALIQELARLFQEENGSIICRELLGLPPGASEPAPQARDEKYYRERPCERFVRSAARIIDAHL